MSNTVSINRCRCGSGQEYAACCSAIINDFSLAETAEQLMRARYTAYTQNNMTFIKKTMQGNALKAFYSNQLEVGDKSVKWIGLTIHSSKTLKKRGTVDFTAHYVHDGKKFKMREHSVFKKINNCWYYVDIQD